MKIFCISLALFICSQSNAQYMPTIDAIKRNLSPSHSLPAAKWEMPGSFKNRSGSPPIIIDQCYKSGDFYISIVAPKSVLKSNIFDLSSIDTILLPANEPFDGSIGILSDEGILLQPIADSVFYFSQDGWSYYGSRFETNGFFHCAGGNKSVFYMGDHLWHMNGSLQPQVIYENIKYTCADLVVDNLERAWVLTGTTWPISDTLRVIDSTGMQICAFPLIEPINTINAYGMMMNQNKIWLGIGRFNNAYPSKLLPLDIIDNQVIPGVPIDFPDRVYFDFESCEVGLPADSDCFPSSIATAKFKSPFVQVFPNPGSDWIQIKSDILPDKIEIMTTTGLLYNMIIPHNLMTEINIESLTTGLYVIKVQSGVHVNMIKLIKK
jgi:hypothetical protein